MTLTLVSRWAPMLAVRMRRSTIRCRESRSPIGCCESLLVGGPKLFLSAQPIGPTRPSEGYCALSEASWVLSARYRPLSSRGWWPVGPVRRLRELSHCRQLGSSWPGLQPRCSSIGRQGSPVPMRWAIAGPRLSPPRPVAPKPRSSLRRSVGPTHAC